MDAQKILIALQHTYNPAEAQRKEAEAHLKQWESAPGYIVSLLQIVAANEVDLAIRQAGSIALKNMAKKWRPYEVDPGADADEQLDFPEADRSTVKDNIVEALIHAPPLVQSQLASTITSICNADFPEKWDGLIPKIANMINTQNPAYMHGALLALLMAFKKYSFITDGKKRAPLHNVVNIIFPLLLQVFSHLSTNDSIESAALQRLLCKIFYATINMSIPPYLCAPEVLQQWMVLLMALLEKQIPESIQPADLDERPRFPWWGAKKWAARVLERFIRRYMKPKKADKKSNKKFAAAFSAEYAVKAMETFLRVLAVKRGGGGYLPDKFTQTVLAYIRMCIRFGTTYVALKPHLEVLTQEILFPYLCLSNSDKALWEEDPVEYLRKEFDPIAEYNNPRTETINFITDLVMLRGKQPLNKFMSFVVQLLIKYTSAPEESRNYREKDGCLHAIGSLSPWLYRMNEYRNNLERMLLVHVFPEFSSPHGFLRARACWIFSQFHKVKFENPENFKGAVQKVLTMMHDTELPVRVQAGLSLRFLILAPKVEDLLRPFLPLILEAVFKLMNEIESDDLVATLERLIDHFGEEMAPYSVALCSRLTEAFMRFYKNADEMEDDDTAAAAALECLMALRSLLRGVRTMPHIYAQLNPILLPMLTETLNENSIEYFEELLRILTFTTFYGEVAPMWPTFPLIHTAFDLWASDYISDMIPPIDNFISRGTEVFLSGPYLDMVMNMYKKLVANKDSDEQDAGQATELIESVLHNCRGRVDRVLPEVLSIAVQRLAACEDKDFRVLLLEVIANALYYNPALTLQILEAQGSTQAVFTTWLQAIPSFKRHFDIKLVVLGLASIFELPLASLPPLIQQGSKSILEALVKLLRKSEKLRKEAELNKLDREHEKAVAEKEEKEKLANGTATDDGEDSDDDIIEMHDIPDDQDADAIDSDDEDMELAMLSSNVKQILGDDGPVVDIGDDSADEVEVDGEEYEDDDEDDDDDDDDDEYDDSSDEEYITIIDKVDELVYFAGRIHTMFATNNATFQGLLGSLSPDDQKELQTLVEGAKTREAENAQKEQERLLKAQQKAQQKSQKK